jgi:hypothetical protein
MCNRKVRTDSRWRAGAVGPRRSSAVVVLLGLFTIVTMLDAATPSLAQSALTAIVRSFDIPAQPLDTALQTYGNQAGVQVLYESELASGRHSTVVRGEFTPAAALDLLLTGTDFVVREVRPSAITLALPAAVRQSDDPPASPLQQQRADLSLGEIRVRDPAKGGEGSAFQDYNAAVQADIQSALRKNAKTRSGSYHAVLDLWIDPSRTIQRTTLRQSSGDIARDGAIAEILQGLTINREPPPHMPQPVRIDIAVREVK